MNQSAVVQYALEPLAVELQRNLGEQTHGQPVDRLQLLGRQDGVEGDPLGPRSCLLRSGHRPFGPGPDRNYRLLIVQCPHLR